MPYDRDLIVAGVTRYYALLARMAYLDASTIQHPPTKTTKTTKTTTTTTSTAAAAAAASGGDDDDDGDGWPDSRLPVSYLRHRLGRSETAIDLLRHLPYLSSSTLSVWPNDTKSLSYLRDGPQLRSVVGIDHNKHDQDVGNSSSSNNNNSSDDDDKIPGWPFFPSDENLWPPSFVSLTTGNPSIAIFLLVDTDTGKIFPNNNNGPPSYLTMTTTTNRHVPSSPTPPPPPPPQEDEKSWLGGLLEAAPAGIEAAVFFDVMCARLAGLELVPAPKTGGWDPEVLLLSGDGDGFGVAGVVKGLLRKYGWKGEEEEGDKSGGFDKAGYLKEVEIERPRAMVEWLDGWKKKGRGRRSTIGAKIVEKQEEEEEEKQEKVEEKEKAEQEEEKVKNEEGGTAAAAAANDEWGDDEEDGEWVPDDDDDDEYDSEEEDSDGDSEYWSEDDWSDEGGPLREGEKVREPEFLRGSWSVNSLLRK